MNAPKRILILTVGTRGDAQPFIALAAGLRRAGHDAILATLAEFEPLARERGVPVRPVTARMIALAGTQAGAQAIAGKGNKLALIRSVMPMLREMMDSAWEATRDAEAIVFHPKAMAGAHIAEKLGIPAFAGFAIPALTPTAAFPNPLFATRNLGPLLNRATYALFDFASLAPYRGLIGRWRRETLGLPPAAGPTRVRTTLYAYSPHVAPVPADWGAEATVTGYWFLDGAAGWQPPDDLSRFLDAGAPPVYVGFGSMPSEDAAATTRVVIEAARKAGARALLATGWGGLTADLAGDDVFALQSAPHDWLFQRVAAVVHHGGAGTTAAGLRAGRPTVICPFFGDQPFWGARVRALGAGPAPIPHKRLTADALAAAMRQAVTDAGMRARAGELGEKLRAEDGVSRAVEAIERAL